MKPRGPKRQEKITLTVNLMKYARLKAMADEREMPVEAFASEVLEMGLMSLKSSWPKIRTGDTNDVSYSVTIDID